MHAYTKKVLNEVTNTDQVHSCEYSAQTYSDKEISSTRAPSVGGSTVFLSHPTGYRKCLGLCYAAALPGLSRY